ncbi:MAG TPA: hypothetical protein VFF79_04775 [Conexibacter sp.]|nr:hypothetical protein [Conexibacter sp.]
MRRVALFAVVLTVGVAAPAAGWVELPPHPIPGDGVADCLRSAGPGRLALLGRLGRTTSAIDLLTVGSRGIAPGTTTTLGWLATCAEVGTAPGARALLVGSVVHNRKTFHSVVQAAEPGATPVTLGPEAVFDGPPSVAVAQTGAAVVAWVEALQGRGPLAEHVLAAVRPTADAPFEAPVMQGNGSLSARHPAVGIDAAGHATAVWVSRGSPRGAALLRIASTTDGERFAAPQSLASATGNQVALAVTPAGRTLIVNYGFGSVTAYERAAGASTFAPVALPVSGSLDELAVALADDGSAVVAARSAPGPTSALLRRPGGVFGHEQLLEGGPADNGSSSVGYVPSDSSGPAPPPDVQGSKITAALDGSGRVLVTWVDPGERNSAASAHVARGTISGGLTSAVRVGSPCRAANAAQPLMLSDGGLGAAWTDNARMQMQDAGDTLLGGGLLHVLVPGRETPTSDGPSPGLSASLLGPRALHGGQALRLRVRCRRGPCVVRAIATAYALDPSSGNTSLVGNSVELSRGRPSVLTLEPFAGQTFARRGEASARLSLVACAAAGSSRVTRLALHLRLRRLPLLPVPRVLQLVARRHGSLIHVTWRTSIPARGATFDIYARPTKLAHLVYAAIGGRGRTRFSVTLHEQPGTRERAVEVQVGTNEQPYSEPVTTRIH